MDLAKLKFGYSGYAAENKVEAAANSYVDTLLTNVRPELNKYDPLSLPYMKEGFSKKVIEIPSFLF